MFFARLKARDRISQALTFVGSGWLSDLQASTFLPRLQLLCPDTMVLQGLAPKSESIKIFDKLKTKPANKVPSPAAICVATRLSLNIGLLRLRRKESNMDLRPPRYLPVSGLLRKSPQPRRAH